MDRVQAYPLSYEKERSVLNLPQGANVLGIVVKYEEPHIIARVRVGVNTQKRAFYTVQGAAKLPDDAGEFVGVFTLDDEAYYVFEAPGE